MVTVPHGHVLRQGKCDPTALRGRVTVWHINRMAKQAHYIKEWRKDKGWTQQELADAVGVDRTYVSKIEKGAHKTSSWKRYDQPFLEAAAKALGCSEADLLGQDPRLPRFPASNWEQLEGDEREKFARMLEAYVKKTGIDSK